MHFLGQKIIVISQFICVTSA